MPLQPIRFSIGPIQSSAVAPTNTVAPAVTGSAVEGQVLTCSTGTWTGTAPITYAYQWQRDASNISGATASTRTLTSDDVGTSVRCVVTATNSVDSVSENSNAVTPVSTLITTSLIGEWLFTEGSGAIVPNQRATGRSGSYVNILHNVETPASLIASAVVGSVTITNNDATGHDGVTPAARFLTSSAASWRRANLVVPTGTYTVSCYVKSRTVGVHGQVQIGINNGASTIITTTDSWQRISYTAADPTSISFRNNQSSPAVADVLVSGLQLELGSSATTWQRPQHDIVSTVTGNTTSTWQNGGLSFTSALRMVGQGGASALTSWTLHGTFKQASADASSSSDMMFFATTSGSNNLTLENSDGELGDFAAGANYNQSGTTADDAWHVLSCSFNGTVYTLYLDGVAMHSTTYALNLSMEVSKLFGRGALSLSYLYSAAQTATQVQTMVGHIRTRMVQRAQTIKTPTVSLIWQGDSITFLRPGLWVAAKTRYPQPIYQTNLGLSGALTSSVQTVVWTPGIKNVMVLWVGTNNLANITNSDGGGAAVAAKLKTLCQTYRSEAIAAGATSVKIYVVTMLPRKTLILGSGVTVGSLETNRGIFNSAIVADTSYYDGRIDVHLDPIMGTDPNAPDNTTYFSDGTHLAQGGVDQLQPLFNAALDAEFA